MDRCPLCLNEQASVKKISDGFREGPVAVTPGIATVTHVTCPECKEYDITDDAIRFLKRCDGMRQRAVKDMCKRGLIGHPPGKKKIPKIDSAMLQEYWKPGDDDERTR
jgi:hypothetical protein